jgi:hypothetical protein
VHCTRCPKGLSRGPHLTRQLLNNLKILSLTFKEKKITIKNWRAEERNRTGSNSRRESLCLRPPLVVDLDSLARKIIFLGNLEIILFFSPFVFELSSVDFSVIIRETWTWVGEELLLLGVWFYSLICTKLFIIFLGFFFFNIFLSSEEFYVIVRETWTCVGKELFLMIVSFVEVWFYSRICTKLRSFSSGFLFLNKFERFMLLNSSFVLNWLV